jgi:hypothetical protein
MELKAVQRWPLLLLANSVLVLVAATHREDAEDPLHHLGSPSPVQLSHADLQISMEAHRRHLKHLEQLDDGSAFGGHFFPEKKSRTKRGGNEKNNPQQQNAPGYVALPLPPLPADVLEHLSEAKLLGRPDPNLVRLANHLSEQRAVLPPVVNPLPPKGPAPPPADAFEPVPKFPSSIQDVMTNMGIHGFPPSDQGYPPEYNSNPPLQYPPFTHKPKPPAKPVHEDQKLVTVAPKKAKPKVVPPPAPIYPNSIQDVMHQIGVLEPHLQSYTPPPHHQPPIVYPPPASYEPPTKKPKKKKKKNSDKDAKTKAQKSPAHPPPTSSPKHPTTPGTYAHTRPTVVVTYDDHTRAPEPFPEDPPAQPPRKSAAPRDPNNYMAVIPYNDVYKLFELLNKHASPTKVPTASTRRTTTPLPPATTKRTEKLRAKVVKKTPDEGYNKKKKRKKPKKTVTVWFLLLRFALQYVDSGLIFSECIFLSSG